MQKSRGTLGSAVHPIFKLHLEFSALISPQFVENKILPPPTYHETGSEWKAEGLSGLAATESKLCSSFCALEHGAASLYKIWG